MAFTPSALKQQNIAVNIARKLAFFEGSELCYNYGTQQWTAVPAYATVAWATVGSVKGYYSVNTDAANIGLVVHSSGSVDLQSQLTTYVAQTAVIATGARDPNMGGRSVVTGVRPNCVGGTHTIRVGKQDSIGGSVTYDGPTSPNTRSGMANFRTEGRYVRVEDTITGGFTTALGVDVEFSKNGRI